MLIRLAKGFCRTSISLLYPGSRKERFAVRLTQGAYILADVNDGDPELILIASSSEVILALGAHEKLISEGIRSRVVSMPSSRYWRGSLALNRTG